IYSFCRIADDAGDESPDTQTALERLDTLEQGVHALSATDARDLPAAPEFCGPLWPALAETMLHFEIPKQPLLDLISAFRQDQRQPHYEDWESLIDYCRRSANPVGRIVLKLGGVDETLDASGSSVAERSDQICTGLQLANFWQDVSRDFHRQDQSRIYLPADRMAAHGVTRQHIRDGEFSTGFADMMRELIARTDQFFDQGSVIADRRYVPKWLVGDLKLFVAGGRQVLRAIESQQYDVLRSRPVVSKLTQMRLTASAALGWL
ncbi:MAG: squalene/phytoene synthase family protein, partial [Planctomycetota bacterium]